MTSRKTSRSRRFGLRQLKPIEERKDPLLQIEWVGDFEREDTVPARSHRSHAEDTAKKRRRLFTDLRHVERQRDAPGQSTVTLSTDGDIEASLTIDESGYPVA